MKTLKFKAIVILLVFLYPLKSVLAQQNIKVEKIIATKQISEIKPKVTSKSKSFVVNITKKNKKLILKCEKGCAWKNLSFNPKSYKPRFIDEFGLGRKSTIKNKKSQIVANEKRTNLADFKFSVLKTNEGLTLKSLKGTAWKKLEITFKKGRKVSVNEYGVKYSE